MQRNPAAPRKRIVTPFLLAHSAGAVGFASYTVYLSR
jgi:hypothetical protein